MNSNRFNTMVIFQVVLIAVTSGLFIWAVSQDNKVVTSISLAICWVIEIILLIKYVNSTNRNLLVFLQSFRWDDSSLVFSKNKKLPFKPVYDEFNRITEQFRNLKIQKEIEHQYFEQVIKHVDTGLLAWDEKEKVHLFNHAARRILQIPHMGTLEGLNKISPDLSYRFRSIRQGTTEVLKLYERNEIKNIYIKASAFNLDNHKVKLVSLQNIRPELEEKEAEAWQRMIKVLTHEIINSVGPVKLVSSSLMKSIQGDGQLKKPVDLSEEDLDNIFTGLKAIHTRSLGLSKFVDDYQVITEIPKPVVSPVSVSDLVTDVVNLLLVGFLKEQVKVVTEIKPAGLRINMDRRMVEQILINIIKNAIHALEDHSLPMIRIKAWKEGRGSCIEVEDNGSGIPFNVLDYIFMPFFTTKKNGSGIGLTLARQLMRAQHGKIKVYSRDGEGTLITLMF